ncbi:MAG: hypothetical protein A2017_11220 [Lentisphaerae bacterium GWF2_44_16]|nr:MAG: hypothetical protein A2017_11220 [Lentisphaerae bacterium GWF2_44_16]
MMSPEYDFQFVAVWILLFAVNTFLAPFFQGGKPIKKACLNYISSEASPNALRNTQKRHAFTRLSMRRFS